MPSSHGGFLGPAPHTRRRMHENLDLAEDGDEAPHGVAAVTSVTILDSPRSTTISSRDRLGPILSRLSHRGIARRPMPAAFAIACDTVAVARRRGEHHRRARLGNAQ